jgi:1-acyl-sn-glycerol-3-phosphate acyltransferase
VLIISKNMRNFLSYLLTPIFYLHFGGVLGFFHPIQVLAHWIFGEKARNSVVTLLNLLLVKGLYIMGCRIKFQGFNQIPANRPIILIANHQSMFDIPVVVWGFRKCYPKFISKAELGKGLPSISYNLKHGKSALIDRKNRGQALKEIFKLGRLIEENNHTACIFPEGTRSKTGQLKEFKTGGIEVLLRAAPSAIIVPLVINGHSQLMEKGSFPLKFGQKVTYTVLEPVEPDKKDLEALVTNVRNSIKETLEVT